MTWPGWCRHRRPLTELDNRLADQLFLDFVPGLLPTNFADHRHATLPLTAGCLHFIRFVTTDGSCTLLNESWHLDAPQWAGKTIRATIDTQAQQLSLFHQAQGQDNPVLVKQFAYPLREDVVPLAARFRRDKIPLWSTLD